MKRFQVGKTTVYNALKKLAEAGIITRTKKKGTFVNAPIPKTTNRQVGVLIRPKGHFFSDLSQAVKEKLLENLCFPVFIDFSAQLDGNKFHPKQRKILNNFLSFPNDGIIFDGESYFVNPFLQRFPDTRSVVVNFFESSDEIPGSAVLADFEQGMYMATSHLIANGHKNILFSNSLWEKTNGADETCRQRHPFTQLTNGYSRAMKHHNLEEYGKIVYRNSDESSHVKHLVFEMLSGKNRPTAIICDYDHLALQVIRAVTEQGIKVPGDLAVIGTYNTPWCEMSPIKITSINFHEEEIGRKAAELILSENKIKQVIKVKPELVIRESG